MRVSEQENLWAELEVTNTTLACKTCHLGYLHSIQESGLLNHGVCFLQFFDPVKGCD